MSHGSRPHAPLCIVHFSFTLPREVSRSAPTMCTRCYMASALSCGWTRLFIGDPPAGYVACAIRGFLQVEGTHKCHGAAEANRYMESNVFLSITDRDPSLLGAFLGEGLLSFPRRSEVREKRMDQESGNARLTRPLFPASCPRH